MAARAEHAIENRLGKPAPAARINPPLIPTYLQETYRWAYLHPKSILLFEREWVVNLVHWGNMRGAIPESSHYLLTEA